MADLWIIQLLLLSSSLLVIGTMGGNRDDDVIVEPEVCSICACPKTFLANPFVIDCRHLMLNAFPTWGHLMDTTWTEVDNVHLLMDGNLFRTLRQVAPSTALDALSMESNGLEGIEPFALALLPHLKALSLADNALGAPFRPIHPDAFRSLPPSSSGSSSPPLPLEVLDLSRNRIFHLDFRAFEDLGRLQVLDLSGNPFLVLDGATINALASLSSSPLRVLKMADASLEALPEVMAKRPIAQLRHLDLSDNRFTEVPEVLMAAQDMEELSLDGNKRIRKLDAGSFVGLKTLRILNVSRMDSLLAVHSGTFHPLKELRVLNCEDNKALKTIEKYAFTDDKMAEGPRALQSVNLRRCNLSALDEALFRGMTSLEVLQVQENPLRCSCALSWLQATLNPTVLNETRCRYGASTPSSGEDQWVSLSSVKLPPQCPPHRMITVEEDTLEAPLVVGFSTAELYAILGSVLLALVLLVAALTVFVTKIGGRGSDVMIGSYSVAGSSSSAPYRILRNAGGGSSSHVVFVRHVDEE